MRTSSDRNIIAIDYSYQGVHFGAVLHGGAITTFEQKRFSLDLEHLLALAKRYRSKHFVITGPGTHFLPAKHQDIILEKKSRLDCIVGGIQFAVHEAPTLVILFELGCHLFLRSQDTVYLGSLPYTFSSFGLENNVSIETEMGHSIAKPLNICETHALPHSRVQDRYETLIAYTLALGIKEFTARYNLNHIIFAGTITSTQSNLLTSFLFPPSHSNSYSNSPPSSPSPITNSELLIPNSPVLPYPEHIAIFGMLSPYLESNAGEN